MFGFGSGSSQRDPSGVQQHSPLGELKLFLVLSENRISQKISHSDWLKFKSTASMLTHKASEDLHDQKLIQGLLATEKCELGTRGFTEFYEPLGVKF